MGPDVQGKQQAYRELMIKYLSSTYLNSPKGMRLQIIKKQKHFVNDTLMWTPWLLVYILTNRYHVGDPVQLKITWLDRIIPFVPFMIPVYLSYLVGAFVFIACLRDEKELNEIFFLSYIQLLISVPFFIFYPVFYPKDVFYNANTVTSAFNQIWLWFDAGNNCFPSLHTANSMLGIFYSLNFPLHIRCVIIPWGLLIILSALVCKQHYVIDVAGGLIVCWLSIKIGKHFNLCD